MSKNIYIQEPEDDDIKHVVENTPEKKEKAPKIGDFFQKASSFDISPLTWLKKNILFSFSIFIMMLCYVLLNYYSESTIVNSQKTKDELLIIRDKLYYKRRDYNANAKYSTIYYKLDSLKTGIKHTKEPPFVIEVYVDSIKSLENKK